MRFAGADDVLQRFEDGRVAGLVEVADAVVAAVDRQEVLNQVVGADGNEVDERGCCRRSWRRTGFRSCSRC